MKYKLSNVTRKTTSTGKAMIKCTLTNYPDDASAVVITDVAIWSSFLNFSELKDGDVVEGELKITQKGNFTNKNLESPTTGTTARSGGGFKGNMDKVMEKKNESITHHQENKELGIKISSTMRMAVDIALVEVEMIRDHKETESTDISRLILKWRKWLWENWDAKDSDFAPFPKRTPDMRVAEEDRDIRNEDITFDQF